MRTLLSRLVIVVWLLCVIVAFGGLIDTYARAQFVEGIDVKALRDRAKLQGKDLEAFTAEVGKRGEALRQEALATRAAAQANRARVGKINAPGPKDVFDFDAMISGADKAVTESDAQGCLPGRGRRRVSWF